MGNIKVLVRDPESVNFDKICRLTLEIVYVRKLPLGDVIVVGEGDHDVDVEGEACDREYWKLERRSMTENYAYRLNLGTYGAATFGEEIPGLVALCRSLAENHGKVPGVKGGSLYQKGMVPSYAKGLTLLPDRASEIVGRLVRFVAALLSSASPRPAFHAGPEWDGLDSALAQAERAVYEKARDTARDLQRGRCANGSTFPLELATGQYAPQGIALETRNPNLMKHLWAATKAMGPSFLVAAAVVSHPDTKRIAVLSSTQYPVDIRPVAEELKRRFPEADFDVNVERGSIVWDPRSNATGPTPKDMQEIVSKRLAFKKDEREARPTGIGATIGDALRLQARKRR